MNFAFILCSLSRPAFRLVRQFIPLPCERTIHTAFQSRKEKVGSQLINIGEVREQIQLFLDTTGLPEGSVVSVAVDAMAMNPDRSYLPTKQSEYAFVVFVQPLNRRYRCLPLHVRQHVSGQATPDIRQAVTTVCDVLSAAGLIVKYKCADGDKGHNKAHEEFFNQWYALLKSDGLQAVIDFVCNATNIPVSDFLHLLKNFCNKIKNHAVVLSPDSLANIVTCEELQNILELGRVLTDKSSTAKMRDSYALKLFSLTNCFKCIESESLMELMYLLPWALQEEVFRSPGLSRQERLDKAILSFKLLLHYYHLSGFPSDPAVFQRFKSKGAAAVTFAENSDWPRLLNSALAVIAFIMIADEDWSFSRLGTHCLENFFGFVRRSSLGDDRFNPTLTIITKATLVYEAMHELDLEIKHSGRDNIGGTRIGDSACSFDPNPSEIWFQSLIHLTHLAIDPAPGLAILSLDEMGKLLREWSGQDHHASDPICKTDISLVSNCRITARNIGTS
jgi:hypothetical protein